MRVRGFRTLIGWLCICLSWSTCWPNWQKTWPQSTWCPSDGDAQVASLKHFWKKPRKRTMFNAEMHLKWYNIPLGTFSTHAGELQHCSHSGWHCEDRNWRERVLGVFGQQQEQTCEALQAFYTKCDTTSYGTTTSMLARLFLHVGGWYILIWKRRRKPCKTRSSQKTLLKTPFTTGTSLLMPRCVRTIEWGGGFLNTAESILRVGVRSAL